MSSFEFQSCRDYPYFAITKIERFSPLEYYLDLARPIKQSEIPAAIMEEMKKDAFVVATGGLANLITTESSTINAVEHFLTLEGLQIIYELNL